MEQESLSRAGSTSPAESTEEASPITFETRDELLAAIRRQVEYYFSKENLQSDAFLVSKMDANMAVPISVVMKFSKMKRLTTTESDLVEALSTSKNVHIIDGKIKANIKQERNTIILREIPSDTPDAEILTIFEGTRPVKNVRSDVGDTWFVSFESEDDAREALLAIRDRKFNGQSVKARLKVENILRSFYTPPAPGLDGVPVTSPMGVPFGMMGAFPGMAPPFAGFGDRGAGAKPGSAAGRAGEKGASKGGKEKDRAARKNGQAAVPAAGARKDGRRRAERGRGDRKEEARGRSDSNVSRSGLNLTAANFPPLPLVETPIPQAGYQGEFTQYTVDELLQIVQRISKDDAKLAEDVDPAEHPQAMDTAPNMDLLLRQRTFSIDETREQLRQGRPVQRDAVIAGGVDYGALMYGEHYDNKPEGATAQQPAVPKGYAAALMAGGKATPEQPVPMKATAKPPATPQKQQQQPQAASAAKSAPKDAGKEEKPAKAGKASRRGKGNRGSESAEAQPAKAGKATKKSDAEQPEKPSTWGGRPTFLDVLRKQEAGGDATNAPAPKQPAATNAATNAAPAGEA